MIWWTELAGQGALNPCDAFVKNQVSSSFGSLLRSVRVPSTSPGRTVAMLTAVTDGDFARRDAILSEVQDHEEEQFLRAIAFPVDTTRSADQGQTEGDPTGDSEDVMIHAFKNGRYGVVLDQFVDRPSPDQRRYRCSVCLGSRCRVAQAKYAGTILTAVRTWASTGLLEVDRRLHRDLEDLERTVDGTCGGWLEWSRRLEGETRWADASSVLRNQLTSWGPLNDLTAQQNRTGCRVDSELGGRQERGPTSIELGCSVPHRINGNFQSRRQRFLPGRSRGSVRTGQPQRAGSFCIPGSLLRDARVRTYCRPLSGYRSSRLRRCGCGLHRPMPLIGQ